MKNRIYHIPIFVPHKGCPHDCVFCNQRHITGQISDVGADDAVRIIEKHLETIGIFKDSYIEIAFFGGSFTGIEFEKQTELLSAAYEYVKSGKVQGIRCSTRPDCIDEKIVQNLKRYGVTCVELGVQSTDEEVLKMSRRGHSYKDVVNACSVIKKYEISLGLQMMLALPGDTFEKSVKTASDLISLKPDCVRIYPTLVVNDTALFNMYEKGLYKPLSAEKAADWLAEIIPMFTREKIDVIRVGLQTTDEINENTVKGPYHPAIKEMAISKICLNAIKKAFPQKIQEKTVAVECAPELVSALVGQKSRNRNEIENYLNAKIKIIQNKNMSADVFKICDKNIEIYG